MKSRVKATECRAIEKQLLHTCSGRANRVTPKTVCLGMDRTDCNDYAYTHHIRDHKSIENLVTRTFIHPLYLISTPTWEERYQRIPEIISADDSHEAKTIFSPPIHSPLLITAIQRFYYPLFNANNNIRLICSQTQYRERTGKWT